MPDIALPDQLARWLEPQDWVRDSDGPCVSLGEPGRFDSTHLHAPAVEIDPSREGDPYRMWYTGSAQDVAGRVVHLGLAVSGDGVNFERYQPDPVFSAGGNNTVETPTLLRGEDNRVLRENGRLRMWFSSTDRTRPADEQWMRLCETSSNDGLSWDPPRGPQLENCYAPTVLKIGGRYRMWYTDVAADPWPFRHATSGDGVTWHADDTPCMILDQPWEHTRLFYPTVIAVEGGFVMWYGAYSEQGNQHTALGVAVSVDGIHWTKSEHNPVFGPDPSRAWESHYTTCQTILPLPEGGWRIWYASRKAPPFVNKYFAIGTARWDGPGG